jgi:isopenicillin-N epimerase
MSGQRRDPPTHESASAWRIRPDTTYLNHGSFGPAPLPVQAAQAELQRRLQCQPMDFLVRELDGLLDSARARLAQLVGAAADDVVFVDNATTGMNVVAATVPLSTDDEVLANDHEYGAVLRIWRRACGDAGARLVVAPVPLELTEPSQVVEAIFARATARTRLIVVSHITSPTAIVFPVEAICAEARRRGIAVAIDGPHALATLDLDLAALGCDFYTASCHKWLCAPLGSGFLYVHPSWQPRVRPPVLSWGRTPSGGEGRWHDEFGWVGTRDYSAWLAVPAAIDFFESVGWESFRHHGHELARRFRTQLAARTGLPPTMPDDRTWFGPLAAMPLPAGPSEPLQRALWERHSIEAPVIAWNDRRLVRISCHLYNTAADVDRLVAALTAELEREQSFAAPKR